MNGFVAASLSVFVLAAPLGVSAAASAYRLDELETRICSGVDGLRRATAAAAELRRAPVPGQQVADVQQMTGPIDDARRRAFLQQQLNQRMLGAQESIVTSTRQELQQNQDEYRRATGRDFQVRDCVPGQIRTTHVQREQARQEAEQQETSAMMARVLAEGDRLREIVVRDREACEAKRILDMPAQEAARLHSPARVSTARREYAEFLDAHQKFYKRPFDPSRCR